MTSMTPLVAAAVLLFASPVAAQSPPVDTVKAELRAFVTELNAALAAHDRAALERLYADEFYFVHTIGKPIDKAAHIAVLPEKALQLLSYDVHSEAYAIAREVVANPPSPAAKQEALRLLAADAASAPLFEKVLRDKDELRENRQVAAAALNTLNPKKFQSHARAMLVDKNEYDDIQATSLTALQQFGDADAVAQDKALLESVGRISHKASSAKYKKSAKAFLAHYDR